ncbi:hypothetical protein BDV37DRAFT_261431 [Aspergillus pseudonomiae]|uniref:Uncharacterized protein n=1 Tax=Aspergillus pseudonomiae TaxID=1506151 RepID=A0A5N7CYA8_9EURO|nr:uncharacterized protein BDV37DRAFT_261431 [Aspergillus pseudonomiae]KAE8399202.1 hypothetical protein BDV37DRAFT_261431 [Aspergillus pseudonomiae]
MVMEGAIPCDSAAAYRTVRSSTTNFSLLLPLAGLGLTISYRFVPSEFLSWRGRGVPLRQVAALG